MGTMLIPHITLGTYNTNVNNSAPYTKRKRKEGGAKRERLGKG
jgi:hypothetical protein